MTSPEITVGQVRRHGASAGLRPQHETELAYDGGTVVIEGAAFETVPAEAYVFNEPSVLATAAAGNTNPLAGQHGFTGTDGGE